MPECEHINDIVGWLMAVERDITRVPEGNDQLTQLRRARNWSPDRGMCLEERELPRNDLRCSPRRFGTASPQMEPTPFQAERGPFGDNYSWHSGGSVSASIPQVPSQAWTSSPVRCRPVS